jgi:hypothetical protein
LPRGPTEVSEVWRANCRLGWSCHTTIAWSDIFTLPEKHALLTFISRITEKSAAFTLMLMEEALLLCQHHGMLTNIDTICHWSDTGPQYRSLRHVATGMIRFSNKFKCSYAIRVGCEHHMKSLCDSHFGMMEGVLKSASCSQMLVTPLDVVECLTRTAALRPMPKPIEIYTHFVPTEDQSRAKVEGYMPWVNPRTLPSTLKGSHAWMFKLKDTRRASNLSRDGFDVSNIAVRAQPFPGFADTGSYTARTAVGPPPPDDEMAEEEIVPDAVEVLLQSSKTFLGWRVSYRTSSPEDADIDKFILRLQRKYSHYNHVALPPAQRHLRACAPIFGVPVPTGSRARAKAECSAWRVQRGSAAIPAVAVPVPTGAPDPTALELFFDE